MLSLARIFPSSALLTVSAAVVVACNAVNVSGASDDHVLDAQSTVMVVYSPDASDAGGAEASAGGESAALPAAAIAYQGSPLCNASQSTGCCYPDNPTSAQACAQAACQPSPDGGGPGTVGAYIDVSLGCHVVPMAPSGDASAGAAAAGPTCLPGGPGLDGFPCAGPADCAPSYECVGATATCRHYCCNGNVSCESDQFCDIQSTAPAPGTEVPVCMPTVPCTLLAVVSSCPANETCAVVRADGSKSCVAVGEASAGQSCETDHCARGLVCLGAPGARSCYVLCHTETAKECAPGQACQGGLPLFPAPDVGICQ